MTKADRRKEMEFLKERMAALAIEESEDDDPQDAEHEGMTAEEANAYVVPTAEEENTFMTEAGHIKGSDEIRGSTKVKRTIGSPKKQKASKKRREQIKKRAEQEEIDRQQLQRIKDIEKGKRAWTRNPGDKSESVEHRIDTLRQVEERNDRDNWVALTRIENAYVSETVDEDHDDNSAGSLSSDGESEPWESVSRPPSKEKLRSRLEKRREEVRKRRVSGDERQAKCTEVCKDIIGAHVLSGEGRDQYIRERGCKVITARMAEEYFDDACTYISRHCVWGERTTLDGRSVGHEEVTWYGFSDEQKMKAADALYNHHDQAVLNGRNTGLQMYTCYECGHTHIGGIGTIRVKIDPVSGKYDRIKDDLTILTVHEEISRSIRSKRFEITPDALARSAKIGMDQAEWILAKGEMDRSYEERMMVSKCAESMSKLVFAMEVEQKLEEEAKWHDDRAKECRRVTRETLIGCVLCAKCAQRAFPRKNYMTHDGRITTEFSEEARESIKVRKMDSGLNTPQAKRLLRHFDLLATEIAHECRDHKLQVRLDTLCLAFPRNYLDYQAAIGQNMGLFYRCTGRKPNVLGQLVPTYGCYIAACHNHWYEIDRNGKWKNHALRKYWSSAESGYVCPFCRVPYPAQDLRDRLLCVRGDQLYGKTKNGQHYFSIGCASDHGIEEAEWKEIETQLDFVKLVGDACMRASRGWEQLTSDFLPKINRSNMLEYFAQASTMTLDMIENIGLTVRMKDITTHDKMVEIFGDVFVETSGLQPGTTSIPVLHCPEGAEQIRYYSRLPVIHLEYLKSLIYGVLAGFPLWLLQIRDTPFDETEFAWTEAGNKRSGVAHEVRKTVWEHLRVDGHAETAVPPAVADKQPDGFGVAKIKGRR